MPSLFSLVSCVVVCFSLYALFVELAQLNDYVCPIQYSYIAGDFKNSRILITALLPCYSCMSLTYAYMSTISVTVNRIYDNTISSLFLFTVCFIMYASLAASDYDIMQNYNMAINVLCSHTIAGIVNMSTYCVICIIMVIRAIMVKFCRRVICEDINHIIYDEIIPISL